ncbi:Coiled-coil and C2 domain-containing protein 2A [Boothiomyces sp. JEL0866]|nr:Coiled-coil and C2 domain-containing protein 2A [Boothiomyces sp. JEL0866]
MNPERQQLIDRVRQRLKEQKEKGLNVQVEKEPDKVAEMRYRRTSLIDNLAKLPGTLQIPNHPPPTQEVDDIITPLPAKDQTKLLSPVIQKTPSFTLKRTVIQIDERIPMAISKLLERGVTLCDTAYNGVQITPLGPTVEPDIVKRRKALTKRKKKEDNAVFTLDEIQEINEIEELYSPNGITALQKWSPTTIFSAEQKSKRAEGFYEGDIPVITPWNYDRLLRRLSITKHNRYYILIFVLDPLNYIHYKALPDASFYSDLEARPGFCETILTKATLSNVHELLLEKLILVVNLSSVEFENHPLMLQETKMCIKLEKLVKAYQQRKRNNNIDYLTAKIEAIRATLAEEHMQLETLRYTPTISDENLLSPRKASLRLGKLESERSRLEKNQEDKIIQLLKDIFAMRKLRDSECKINRDLEYKIVKYWEDIKAVRKHQGFTSNDLKLSIKLKKRKKNLIMIDVELENELNEYTDLYEIEYQQELREYHKKEMGSISKSSSLKRIDEEDDKNFSDSDMLIKKEESLAISKSKANLELEPQKKTVSKTLKSSIMKRLRKSHPSKDSHILDFALDHSTPVTIHMECPEIEQYRRKRQENTFFHLVVKFNNKTITQTVPKQLSNDFLIKFNGISDLADMKNTVDVGDADYGTAFCIQIREVPRSIQVQIYETCSVAVKPISKVNVPLPAKSDFSTALDRELNYIEFSGESFDDLKNYSFLKYGNVSGLLAANVSWGVTEDEGQGMATKDLIPKKNLPIGDPLSFHGPVGLLNIPKMIEWLGKSIVDPNDPRNQNLLQIKQLFDTVYGHSKNALANDSQCFFRENIPNWLHELTLGVGVQITLNMSKRFQILKDRFARKIVLDQPVPLHFTEGLMEAITVPNSQRDLTEEETMKRWTSRGNLEKIADTATDLGFLKRIRELQLIRKLALEKPKTVDDYVREERIAPAPEAEFDLFALFRPLRPLNPYRNKKSNIVTSKVESCTISVQILQGLSFPVRQHESQETNHIKLKPFIEVSFQKNKIKSTVSDGVQPLWNQTMFLKVRAPNGDFSPEALMETDLATEILYINIFDEITVDLLEDKREKDRTTYVRRDRVWIGSVKIPFCFIWERARIDGYFPVSHPCTLLGYEFKETEESLPKVELIQKSQLHMFITLDPPLNQPRDLIFKFQTDEDPKFLRHCTTWQETARFPGRHALAITHDMEGKTTFICKYIRPQNPPPSHTTIPQILRFVSMIPFLPNRSVFAMTCHLWATSDQIMNIGAADAIEHAILLCNYLLYLDYKAWVVLGNGILEGKTAAVIVQQENIDIPLKEQKAMYRLYHPMSGKSFYIDDKLFPMMEVDLVFNHENIWLNIQQDYSPDKLKYNFADTSCWKPFFSNGAQKPSLTSIQPPLITYEEVSKKWCSDLEWKLEKAIVGKFEEWRKGNVTRWNRLCSRSLKALISRFEENILGEISLTKIILDSSELSSIGKVYKLNGHPINLPYTDIPSACDAVFNTEIHTNVSQGVEFALAVHVDGYTSHIASVWIFLTSLLKK